LWWQHQPGGVVVGARGVPPRLGEVGDQVEERLVALGEAGGLGRPVVHLDVDVGRPVGVPGRGDLGVPDALEVRRLGAGPRGGDQQVAAVGEEQGGEARVGAAGFGGGEAFTGRAVRRVRRAVEAERGGAEEPAVVGQVLGAQLLVVLSPGARQPPAGLGERGLRAVGLLAPAPVAGTDGDQHHRFVGAGDGESVPVGADLPADGVHAQRGGEPRTPLGPVVGRVLLPARELGRARPRTARTPSGSTDSCASGWGVVKPARKERDPGASVVRRTASTPAGAETKLSLRYATPSAE